VQRQGWGLPGGQSATKWGKLRHSHRVFWDKKMIRFFCSALLSLVLTTSASASLNCSEPPEQLSRDVVVDTKGKLAGLGRLVGLELSNRTEVITRDTLRDYPNADKLLISNAMTSLFCQLLRDSTTISDSDKLDRFRIFAGQVMATMMAPGIDEQTRRQIAKIPKELDGKFLYKDDSQWVVTAPAGAVIKVVGLNCRVEAETDSGYKGVLASDGEIPVVGVANSRVRVTIKLVGAPAPSSSGMIESPDACHGKFILMGID
jgi:hypothetical protein